MCWQVAVGGMAVHVLRLIANITYWLGTAVTQWLRCCATIRKVAGSIPARVSGFLIDIKSFWSHYGPRVDSASNRNEYQEYFLGSKGGRCVRLTTLPPSWAVVTKSGNLNFLELSGPVQACNGADLPFYLLAMQPTMGGPPLLVLGERIINPTPSVK